MKKGFTLIEAIYTLSICLVVLFLILMSIEHIHQLQIKPTKYTDLIIASKQLTLELMQSKVVEIDSDSIIYEKEGETFTLFLDEDKLVKEPGYQIFLYDLDELEFDYDDLIEMKIERGELEYETCIGIYRFTD